MREGIGETMSPASRGTERRSDAELLAASVGAADAFDAFYRRHRGPVLKYVSSRSRDTYTALDLTAEVFAAAYLARGQFRPERGPARGWLFGIAKNKIVDAQRRDRSDLEARRKLGIRRREFTETDLEQAEGIIAATEILEGLPPLEREAVRARILDDRDYADIAAEAAVAPATIRKRVSDGLARLARKQTGDQGRTTFWGPVPKTGRNGDAQVIQHRSPAPSNRERAAARP